ncbi:MAG: hypothetical protein GY721_02025 [Deltaproteobacteria bacterium]|nr:hypothetical protein [Deltaproteobacteria bacterium]
MGRIGGGRREVRARRGIEGREVGEGSDVKGEGWLAGRGRGFTAFGSKFDSNRRRGGIKRSEPSED